MTHIRQQIAKWTARAAITLLCLSPEALSVSGRAIAQESSNRAMQAPLPAPIAPRFWTAEVVATYPHDQGAFTQGLIVEGNTLYESTGQPGESQVRRVDLTSGQVLAARDIPADQFGEGLTRWRNELISLTWQHGIAHRWDRRTLRARGRFRYPGEGWGLTTLGDDLILSDGTATLRVLDPRTFRERRSIDVTVGGRPLRQLNELEIVDGRIWANVWMTSSIAIIDPGTGQVQHVLDCSALAQQAMSIFDNDNVLNGIAFDPVNRRLFVTGKRWPTLFEIRVPDLPPLNTAR
jgi:glutamine cyclotransferase